MKHILILVMNMKAGNSYKKTLLEFFPQNTIDITVHTPDSYAKETSLSHIDLYLVSIGAIEGDSNITYSLPFGVPVVDVDVDYKENSLNSLLKIEMGTKCLFVNASEKLALEGIVGLHRRGIHNLVLYPYAPGMELWENVDLALTPGEPHLVPMNITEVIDLGHRHLTPHTLLEVALKLNMEKLLLKEKFNLYSMDFPYNTYSPSILFKKTSQLEIWLNKLMELMDTGVVGVDEDCRIFCINEKAKIILQIEHDANENMNCRSILPFIDFEPAGKRQIQISNKIMHYLNTDIMVTIHPIVIDGIFRGHFVLLDKFVEMENKQQKARVQMLQKAYNAKYYFSDILTVNQRMISLLQMAQKMSNTSSAILITGESGTGKELLASAIHNASARAQQPYIAINCAAMPESLLESELFGYESGAFTGAKKNGKLGLFEYAHKGTIFLDEIEDMSPSLQVKLLRVLQEKEVMRVGGHTIINVDVRIIAATNIDIQQMVKNGAIRKDLYYRLNTLQLELPPLRERTGDIRLLTEHFIKRSGFYFTMEEDVLEAFFHHPWEGNIRELENYIEYFHCLDKDKITKEDLPKPFHSFNINNKKIQEVECCILQSPSEVQHISSDMDNLLFVLYTIYKHNVSNKPIGRRSLLGESKIKSKCISESEIRKILKTLQSNKWIVVNIGRIGVKITDSGIDYLKLNNMNI